MPKDRGAEHGDVDGPVECSMVAGSTAARQAAGTLLWIGVDDPTEEQRLRADHAARVQESVNFQPGGPEKLTGAHDPQHALQKSGGLADQWYMDNGDNMCHPTLVLLLLQDFDVVNAIVGAERNPLKTEVIDNVIALGAEWKIDDVKKMINNSTVTDGSNTLSVVVGPRQHIADQLFQVCQDPQTSETSLGVCRTNHILRIHGRTILEEQRAAEIDDEIGQRSLNRLFPVSQRTA